MIEAKSILDEAKQFLSDAVIADVNQDTVEVVYNIKRIFDLLSDVEQLGVREELDKIEFEKFQSDFIQIYTTRLNTIGSSTQFLTADLIRRDIASITNQNESVEMGTGCHPTAISYGLNRRYNALQLLRPYSH